MNERIRQLYQQAYDSVHEFQAGMLVLDPVEEKFAELIAYECIDLALGSSHREDDMGAIIANKIRNHFGIKE